MVVFEPPAIQGIGSFGGFQFELQDLGRNTLRGSGPRCPPDGGREPSTQGADGPLHQLSPLVIRNCWSPSTERRPRRWGFRSRRLASTLNVFMGSQYVNDFDFNNRSYRVYVQADQPFRMTAGESARVLCPVRLRAR